MARSSKLDFDDHLFLLYYIYFYGYKHIIIRKYIWSMTNPTISNLHYKNKKLMRKLLVKDRKVWILICVRAL
jgi:hypothetical protein